MSRPGTAQPLPSPALGIGQFSSYDDALAAAVAEYWRNRRRPAPPDDVEVSE